MPAFRTACFQASVAIKILARTDMATAALLTGAGFCVLAALEAQRLGHVVSGRRHVIHAAVMATGAVLALVALRADRSDPEVLSLLPEST